MSPCVVPSTERPGSRTVVPVSAAAARKYEAVDASGSITNSAGR